MTENEKELGKHLCERIIHLHNLMHSEIEYTSEYLRYKIELTSANIEFQKFFGKCDENGNITHILTLSDNHSKIYNSDGNYSRAYMNVIEEYCSLGGKICKMINYNNIVEYKEIFYIEYNETIELAKKFKSFKRKYNSDSRLEQFNILGEIIKRVGVWYRFSADDEGIAIILPTGGITKVYQKGSNCSRIFDGVFADIRKWSNTLELNSESKIRIFKSVNKNIISRLKFIELSEKYPEINVPVLSPNGIVKWNGEIFENISKNNKPSVFKITSWLPLRDDWNYNNYIKE